jgi:hypothetical protein
MERNEIINLLKVITNIILGVLLLIALITIIKYRQEVDEALNFKEPTRLIQIYEERTGYYCSCYPENSPTFPPLPTLNSEV